MNKLPNKFKVFIPIIIALVCSSCEAPNKEAKTPLIYISDLYHPYEDLDDHFDVASIYSNDLFDIQAIIIDNAKPREHTPGRIPVEQLNYITGKNPPVYVGLKEPLVSPSDTGEDQSGYQDGCNAIIHHLNKAKSKVIIISVGSLRDISAAYNREPELFEKKLDKLIIFIGEASRKDKIEYNVALERNAYINVMNNMPNVWWVPCFDGGTWKNKGKASFWQGHHSELLEGVSDQVMNFFLYASTRSLDTINYIDYLNQPVNQADLQSQILDSTIPLRRLWCCAVFPYFTEQKESAFPFTFKETKVYVDSSTVLHYSETGNAVMQFNVTDPDNYDQRMNAIFNNQIKQLSKTPNH